MRLHNANANANPMKRLRESDSGLPGAQRIAFQPADTGQINDNLVDRLERITRQDFPRVVDMLAGLPIGRIDRDMTFSYLFNVLIEQEEYAVLVDAYATFHNLHKMAWIDSHRQGEQAAFALHAPTDPLSNDGHAPPGQATLTLNLRADWSPTNPEGLVLALRAMAVQQVQLSSVSAPGVGLCLATLLEAGATHLRFQTDEPLAPIAVQFATLLANSRLTSVQLGWPPLGQLTPQEVNAYATLAEGLARCATLKHLEIADQRLFSALAPVITAFLKPGGPRLTSVKVSTTQIDDEPRNACLSATSQLMQALRGHPLAKLALQGRTLDAMQLDLMVLVPFANHAHLRELELCFDDAVFQTAADLRVLTNLLEFSITCPLLTTLACELEELPDRSDVLRRMLHITGDLVQETMGRATSAAMGAPGFKLQKLKVDGAILPSSVSAAFLNRLIDNTTLQQVFLQDCVIEVGSTQGLYRLLGHPTLSALLLSAFPHEYFWLAPDGGLCTFANTPTADGEEGTDPFELAFAPGTPEHVQRTLRAAFAPMEPHTSTFRSRLKEVLAANRQQQAQRVRDQQAGARIVQATQAVRARQEAPKRPPVPPLAVPTELLSLEQQRQLYLTRNAMATGDRQRVSALIAEGAPLNAVNKRGANVLLRDAAKANNAALITMLRDNGAHDFGGLARREAVLSTADNAFL